MKKLNYIAILFAVFLAGCTKVSVEDYKAKGAEYFPYNVGSVRYYDVDSIVYDGTGSNGDTAHFKIRETVTEKFKDAAGNEAVRIEQYISRNGDTTYDFFRLVTANTDGYGVQWVENNTRFFVLSFPIRNNKDWNGNIYNNLGKQLFNFSDLDKPFSGKKLNFLNTVTMTRDNTRNLFFDIVFIEVYAKGVGLVYKQREDLEHQNLSNPAQQVGYKLVWHLEEYIP